MFTWVITFTDNSNTWTDRVNRNSIDEALEWANQYKGNGWIISINRKGA